MNPTLIRISKDLASKSSKGFYKLIHLKDLSSHNLFIRKESAPEITTKEKDLKRKTRETFYVLLYFYEVARNFLNYYFRNYTNTKPQPGKSLYRGKVTIPVV